MKTVRDFGLGRTMIVINRVLAEAGILTETWCFMPAIQRTVVPSIGDHERSIAGNSRWVLLRTRARIENDLRLPQYDNVVLFCG